MTAAVQYRCLYKTMWWLNEQFDLRRAKPASNDNWHPLTGGAA